MTGIYYAAVEDDPLTSGPGGRVYASQRVSTIKGSDGKYRCLAFIGDSAYCAACGSDGVIAYGAGLSNRKRMVDRAHGGRLQAVGGDIVLCKCAEPPRIIAQYGCKWVIRDRGNIQPIRPSQTTTPGLIYDEQVRAIGQGAAEGYPYLIEFADGESFSGRLDSGGRLPRIQTDQAGTYAIHWGDAALAHRDWK